MPRARQADPYGFLRHGWVLGLRLTTQTLRLDFLRYMRPSGQGRRQTHGSSLRRYENCLNPLAMAWINQLQNPGDSERIPTVAIAETFIPIVQTEDESIQDKPLSNHPIRHARIIISKPYPMATPDIPKAQDPNYGSYITFHYVDRVTGERST